MAELTWQQSLCIVLVGGFVLWGIIGPWLSQFNLNHLTGIESELRKIRMELEKIRRRDDDNA